MATEYPNLVYRVRYIPTAEFRVCVVQAINEIYGREEVKKLIERELPDPDHTRYVFDFIREASPSDMIAIQKAQEEAAAADAAKRREIMQQREEASDRLFAEAEAMLRE